MRPQLNPTLKARHLPINVCGPSRIEDHLGSLPQQLTNRDLALLRDPSELSEDIRVEPHRDHLGDIAALKGASRTLDDLASMSPSLYPTMLL